MIGPETDFVVSLLNDIPEFVWRRWRDERLIQQRRHFYERELKAYGFTRGFFVELIRESPTRASFIRKFYETYAREKGFRRWGENTPQNFQVARQILRIYPYARFLHLIRDCRDVGLSYTSKDFGPNNLKTAAYLWRWRATMLSRLIKRFPYNFFTIRYEDFISSPEDYIGTITRFLGLSENSINLDSYFNDTSGVYDERVRDVIDKGHIKLWEKNMEKTDSEMMVEICGRYLEKFGYISDYSRMDYAKYIYEDIKRCFIFFFWRKLRMFRKLWVKSIYVRSPLKS